MCPKRSCPQSRVDDTSNVPLQLGLGDPQYPLPRATNLGLGFNLHQHLLPNQARAGKRIGRQHATAGIRIRKDPAMRPANGFACRRIPDHDTCAHHV